MKKGFKVILIGAAVLVLSAVMIIDAGNMVKAAEDSVYVCLNTIIPSLFGFMVISGFLISSSLYKIVFSPLYYIFRFILHVDEDVFSILLLSLIGGYPVGAKLIADYSENNKSFDGAALLPYCYCASPIFIMTIVGVKLYGNAAAGLYVYLINAVSCLLLLIISNLKNPVPKAKKPSLSGITVSRDLLTTAVTSAAVSMLKVCSMIVFFSILIQALRFLTAGLFSVLHPIIQGSVFTFLEISNISLLPRYNLNLLPLISILTSFGGCCIIMQAAAIVRGRVDLKPFISARLPVAMISGLLCKLSVSTLKLDFSLPAVSGGNYNVFLAGTNPVVSLFLVIMSLLLIIMNSNLKKY